MERLSAGRIKGRRKRKETTEMRCWIGNGVTASEIVRKKNGNFEGSEIMKKGTMVNFSW